MERDEPAIKPTVPGQASVEERASDVDKPKADVIGEGICGAPRGRLQRLDVGETVRDTV